MKYQFIFFVVFLCPFIVSGQTHTNIRNISTSNKPAGDTLQAIAHKLSTTAKKHLQYRPFNYSQKESGLKVLFGHSLQKLIIQNKTYATNGDLELLKTKKQMLLQDYGFTLQAGYLQNFEKGIVSSGDIFYKRRLSFEFEWDLLDNGLFENRHKAKIVGFELARIQDKIEQTNKHNVYSLRYNLIIYYFNLRRIQVIKHYLALITQTLSATSSLYQLNYVPWEEVLELTIQKVRLKQKLKSYIRYNKQFLHVDPPSLERQNLPVVDLKLDKVLMSAKLANLQDLKKIINSYEIGYNPLFDINLSVFVRYNLYSNLGNDAITPIPAQAFGGREYFSAGINISIPIPFNASEKKKIQKLELTKSLRKNQKDRLNRKKELYNYYYKYQFALQQFIQSYGKYLKIQEKIRKQKVLNKINSVEYSPRKLTKLISSRYKIALALIGIKQKLYLKLLKIKQNTSVPVKKFTAPIGLNITTNSSTNTEQHTVQTSFADEIYIWSSVFGNWHNSKLTRFLKNHSIDRVLLSISDGQYSKAKNFVKQAHATGIKIYLLVGNNQLIYYKKHKKELKDYVQQAYRLSMDGLHLDVEPQVFDDWETREDEYKKMYIKLIQKTHAHVLQQDLQLSVSIPHYFDDILADIKPYIANASIMAYATDEPQEIIERIEQEIKILGDKASVALRPADFNSIKKLSRVIQKIEQQTDVERFILHALSAFESRLKVKKQ